MVKEGNDVTNELCSDQGNEKEKKHSLKYRVGRNRDKTQKKGVGESISGKILFLLERSQEV